MNLTTYASTSPSVFLTSGGTSHIGTISLSTNIVPKPRYAFMKDFGEAGWLVVIVGNVVEGRGEVLSVGGYFKTRSEADAWRVAQIGDGPVVYTDPIQHAAASEEPCSEAVDP